MNDVRQYIQRAVASGYLDPNNKEQVAEFARTIQQNRGLDKEKSMWGYVPEALWNERNTPAVAVTHGLSWIPEVAGDVYGFAKHYGSFGYLPKDNNLSALAERMKSVEYGNPNDRYLSEGMKRTRAVLGDIGGEATGWATPAGIAETAKLLKGLKVFDGSSRIAQAAARIAQATAPAAKTEKFKDLSLLGKAKRVLGRTLTVGLPSASIVGTGVSTDLDYRTANAFGFKTPQEADRVARSAGFKDFSNLLESVADRQKTEGMAEDAQVRLENAKKKLAEIRDLTQSWYAHPAVGFGGGAVGGGLLGYLVSRGLGAKTPGRVVGTAAGSILGAVAGRLAQDALVAREADRMVG